MGRSTNSRNRVFDPIDGGIAHGGRPVKMTDPHLIIYNPVLTFAKTTIVTNGDQTDTIYDFWPPTAIPATTSKRRWPRARLKTTNPTGRPHFRRVDMATGGLKSAF